MFSSGQPLTITRALRLRHRQGWLARRWGVMQARVMMNRDGGSWTGVRKTPTGKNAKRVARALILDKIC